MNVTVNSYLCGAGLMDIWLMNAGITVNQAFELDGDARKTYQHIFSDHVKECDTSILGRPLNITHPRTEIAKANENSSELKIDKRKHIIKNDILKNQSPNYIRLAKEL